MPGAQGANHALSLPVSPARLLHPLAAERTALQRALHATAEELQACRCACARLQATAGSLQERLEASEDELRRTELQRQALQQQCAAAEEARLKARLQAAVLPCMTRIHLWLLSAGQPCAQPRPARSWWQTPRRSGRSWCGGPARCRACASRPTSACTRRRGSWAAPCSGRASCTWTIRRALAAAVGLIAARVAVPPLPPPVAAHMNHRHAPASAPHAAATRSPGSSGNREGGHAADSAGT